MKQTVFWGILRFLSISVFFCTSCGAAQTGGDVRPDIRPLEEHRAIDIIRSAISIRGYSAVVDVPLQLQNQVSFSVDLRVSGEAIAIEYATAMDLYTTGGFPPAAPGSSLHVVPVASVPVADVAPEDDSQPPESLYLLILHESDYRYQFNPTAQTRSDITFQEVENRLRRTVNDFLTWYQQSAGQR